MLATVEYNVHSRNNRQQSKQDIVISTSHTKSQSRLDFYILYDTNAN